MNPTNNEIVRILFGSNLYGTNTPNSDKDYKAVSLPIWKEIALGKIPRNINLSTGSNNSKNTKEDIDVEVFGIHEFVKLAMEGQTIAFDMLHAPEEMYQYTPHFVWKALIDNRHKFYSKNIHAFIGYAVGQASRYSIKGDRLIECQQVLDFFNTLPPSAKLKECDLTEFPKGEYIKYIPWQEATRQHSSLPQIDLIEVCSKQFQVSCSVEYARSIVQTYVDKYGARAKQAASDEGRDWKAISHAFRVVGEAKELFTKNTIIFPRHDKDFLLQIKTGQIPYATLAPMLDDMIVEVDELKNASSLPEKPDKKFGEDFLIEVVEKCIVPTRLYETAER